MKKSNLVKVVTHVPSEYLEKVQKAIGGAGAGVEGNYKNCSFVLPGTGFFTPDIGAKPTIGNIGVAQQVDEYQLEFTCERKILEDVITVLKQAHLYEEVPIQIYEFYKI